MGRIALREDGSGRIIGRKLRFGLIVHTAF
jgi:hypothetical protein